MEEKMANALAVVRSVTPVGEGEYLGACAYLVAHRDALPCRVFIELPGGMTGNADPRWDAVRAGSESCCNCGNERVIVPATLRTGFERSAAEPIVVRTEKKTYFRPVGGDARSSYMCVWIEQGALAFIQDPLAPTIDFAALFSQPAYPLDKLETAMARQKDGQPAVMCHGKHKTPVFGILSVDAARSEVTLVPDKDVEIFDPDAARAVHGCG